MLNYVGIQLVCFSASKVIFFDKWLVFRFGLTCFGVSVVCIFVSKIKHNYKLKLKGEIKMETNRIDVTEQDVRECQASFCPFGWMDIKTAVQHSFLSGHNVDFVQETVNEFVESCGGKLEDCDPVYCVMDAILQEARNEIEEKTGYDFVNDCEHGEIYTYGNFMCSSYDYKAEAIKELREKIKGIGVSEFSDNTKYFLDEIGLS